VALVKKAKLTGRPARPVANVTHLAPADLRPKRVRKKPETAGERLTAAALELSSGLGQSAAAAEELRRTMEQIAAAAEEAAGAAHESLAAVGALSSAFTQARARSEAARRGAEAGESLLAQIGAEIQTSIDVIGANAERQFGSVQVVAGLERGAVSIGEITASVAELAEQINLLALNAAIEASRAGDDGRGFTIVADEVRALAATAETRAQEVRATAEAVAAETRELVGRIGETARLAKAQVESGRAASQTLVRLRTETEAVAGGAQEILIAAVEAEAAAREAQKGAESISTAAEQQSAAAAEAQRAVQQQASALEQSHRASETLARRTSGSGGLNERRRHAEEIAAAAEQLSATVQQLSESAGQIMRAVAEIGRGGEIQAAATQQSNAAVTEIERSAELARRNAAAALSRARAASDSIRDVRARIGATAEGVAKALAETRATVAALNGLEDSGRSMEKLIDAIAILTVQTTMLSVSGAIEAVRVGEAGRGFALVSNDIRELARQSGGDADRVKDIVRDLQRQCATVRADLTQIIAAAEAETARSRAIDERLAALEAGFEAMVAGAAEISQGAESVLHATGQVAAGAQQIAAAAEETARSAQQSAAAARQQAQAAEALASVIEEIALLAEELQAGAPA